MTGVSTHERRAPSSAHIRRPSDVSAGLSVFDRFASAASRLVAVPGSSPSACCWS
jgi:hypothetical protein